MNTITLTNNFHGTSARTRAHADRETLLTARTVRRLSRALCGIPCCTCGGAVGERGPQPVQVRAMPAGEVMLRPVE